MRSYLNILRDITTHGKERTDRTGTGTKSIFGYHWRHRLSDGFPLLTTKKIHTKSVIHELLWFLSGSTNNNDLTANGVTIWNEWAKPDGDLGPIYGQQWRRWEAIRRGGEFLGIREIDQIATLIDSIKRTPDSRRLCVSAWNPADVPQMAMPPCHSFWQCSVQDGALSLHLYARSIDTFLGLPFNIASYALLTHMIAHVCNLSPGELIISFGDLHIYSNHFEQVAEQMSREPRKLPCLEFARKVTSIDDFKFEDFRITGYDPHPAIKAPVAV